MSIWTASENDYRQSVTAATQKLLLQQGYLIAASAKSLTKGDVINRGSRAANALDTKPLDAWIWMVLAPATAELYDEQRKLWQRFGISERDTPSSEECIASGRDKFYRLGAI